MDYCPIAYINRKEMKRCFLCGEKALVDFSACFLHICLRGHNDAQARINNRCAARAANFCRYAADTLYKQALCECRDAEENAFPFRMFEAVMNDTATFNRRCFLSLYNDRYEFTGGAHGSTLRTSDTFDIRTGSLLPLCSFFDPCTDWCENLLKQITEQADANIAADPNIYFENYRELIRQSFDPCQYYLNDSGIVIYFQQYDIAPYSTGIVEFTIPCRF